MALEMSTAGVTLQYAVEMTTGTRPTSGYTIIPNIKSIPDFNPEPNMIDVTDLSETEFTRYISGLKDLSGSIGFGANLTTAFLTMWQNLVEEYETAKTSEKGMWFAIVIPGLPEAFFFIGQPSPLGLAAMEVNSALETTAYIAPNEVGGFAAKPTTTP